MATQLGAVTALVFASMPLPLSAQIGADLFKGMPARSIGPAGMSGRVAAIDAVIADPNVIYVGSATGGVWKSADGGITWRAIFDDQRTSSIGAVAVDQANPDVVWVGTGEGNPRNSAGVGYGMYKSVDAGRTWSHLGLERSERIHRVRLHPTNPNVAYVAALGPTWSDSDQRGVFKTTDGGRTWRRMLFVNERTGAADLVMDPRNPHKLFAAMWEHRRWPWFFESGGPGSGLYVTYDGGETWTKLGPADGLPTGDLGRIGIAIAAGNPNVVYALVEADTSALLRSDDGGHRWRTVDKGPDVAPRPFYYADIRVDPQNENRLYSIHGRATVSDDGGKTFRTIVPSQLIHGDVHELWIHPADNRLLMMGNDGGVGISYDRGANWRFVENLPLAQYYHINVDMAVPYNVYGGLQDNGSWLGPSAVWHHRGIMNLDWMRVGSGDGFATLTNFRNPRYGYSMSQQGFLRRFDKQTGERKDIRPVHPEGAELRFNWNAAINVDPFDSTTIYFGSQFVHVTRDHGETWRIISPDLTTNDPERQRQAESGGLTKDATGAENNTTIVTIAPSPVERGVLWVGTDDGNVQLTRDSGTTWTNLADRFRDVPRGTWVPHIEPSKFAGGTAFVLFENHQRGDWTPYVFRTTDYGRSWQSIATDEIWGFVHVIEQDPLVADLLYLGTEFGLYVSLNGGRSWMQWTHGVPTVPVRGLIVHPRDHDLVIGTHGRGVFILDDVRPLRALARQPDLVQQRVHVFDPPVAYTHEVGDHIGYRSTGHAMFVGENEPYGAAVTFMWGGRTERTGGPDSARVDVEVLDRDGARIRAFKVTAKPGLNRVAWDLRRDGFTMPTSRDTGTVAGPEVVEGTYTVRIRDGDARASADIDVRMDPRIDVPRVQREAKVAAMVRLGEHLGTATRAVRRLRDATDGIATVQKSITERNDSTANALREAGKSLDERLRAALYRFVEKPDVQGIAGGSTISDGLTRAYASLGSSWDALTQAQTWAVEQAVARLRDGVGRVNALLVETEQYRSLVHAAGVELFPAIPPVELPD